MYWEEWVNGEKDSFSAINQILNTFIQTKKAYKEGDLDLEELRVVCKTLKQELTTCPSRYLKNEVTQIKDMISAFVKKEKSKLQENENAMQ